MAIVTNTALTYTQIGDREDLTDMIYLISPTEVPFSTSIKKGKATATTHEWQTVALAAADGTNHQIEGDTVSYAAADITTRLANKTQISTKTLIVSRTQEKVLKAGRRSEVAFNLMLRGRELKRDIETILLSNQAKVTGNSTTARQTASALSWIHTNTAKGAGGADPTGDGTNARTDGTQASFVELSLKTVLQSIWSNSADAPDQILVGGSQKLVMSSFSGNATRYMEAQAKKIVSNIEVYAYDFGEIKVMPDRFMRSRDAIIVNSDMWSLCWLDAIQIQDMAKTSDSASQKLIVCEYALEACNEAASGGCFDLL